MLGKPNRVFIRRITIYAAETIMKRHELAVVDAEPQSWSVPLLNYYPPKQ